MYAYTDNLDVIVVPGDDVLCGRARRATRERERKTEGNGGSVIFGFGAPPAERNELNRTGTTRTKRVNRTCLFRSFVSFRCTYRSIRRSKGLSIPHSHSICCLPSTASGVLWCVLWRVREFRFQVHFRRVVPFNTKHDKRSEWQFTESGSVEKTRDREKERQATARGECE